MARLEGQWTYFDRPGRIFGYGDARISRSGEMRGRLNLQLDIDTPGGELVHIRSPADFVSVQGAMNLTTPRFEGFMQQASSYYAGKVSATIRPSGQGADVSLSGVVTKRATWEWPSDESIAVFQAELESKVNLPLRFERVAARDRFMLKPTATRWSGYISGALDLGFTSSLIVSTMASGSGVSCFPKLCHRDALEVSLEHLGFEFDLGPGSLELGSCDKACAL